MNCKQARSLFDDSLKGFLIGKERLSLHNHFIGCDHCKELFKRQQTLKQVRRDEVRVLKQRLA